MKAVVQDVYGPADTLWFEDVEIPVISDKDEPTDEYHSEAHAAPSMPTSSVNPDSGGSARSLFDGGATRASVN